MPAVNRAANPQHCLAKHIKFSIKASISDKTELKTVFQIFFLFSAFTKCEKKLESFFFFLFATQSEISRPAKPSWNYSERLF